MSLHKYLSLLPESLVVSMLTGAEFGTYLATGTKKRSHEHAIYFELNDNFENDFLNLEKAKQACLPHDDGQPKHSVYASIYRVLEHVDIQAMGNLWLTTRDGRSLKLTQGDLPKESAEPYHLYQELAPVQSLIVSSLGPVEMCKFITNNQNNISVPKICFVELTLGKLVDDVQNADTSELPYDDISHLKDCLGDLLTKNKTTKTVNRIPSGKFHYRCIKGGFFVGQGENVIHYPFPSAKELEQDNYDWFRSANMA